MKRQDSNTIEISLEDIELILGDSFTFFPQLPDNCFCAKCGHAPGRYIETGESKESVEAANHIRKIKEDMY